MRREIFLGEISLVEFGSEMAWKDWRFEGNENGFHELNFDGLKLE